MSEGSLRFAAPGSLKTACPAPSPIERVAPLCRIATHENIRRRAVSIKEATQRLQRYFFRRTDTTQR